MSFLWTLCAHLWMWLSVYVCTPKTVLCVQANGGNNHYHVLMAYNLPRTVPGAWSQLNFCNKAIKWLHFTCTESDRPRKLNKLCKVILVRKWQHQDLTGGQTDFKGTGVTLAPCWRELGPLCMRRKERTVVDGLPLPGALTSLHTYTINTMAMFRVTLRRHIFKKSDPAF